MGKSRSSVLCYHANEVPRGACPCPDNCPCHESQPQCGAQRPEAKPDARGMGVDREGLAQVLANGSIEWRRMWKCGQEAYLQMADAALRFLDVDGLRAKLAAAERERDERSAMVAEDLRTLRIIVGLQAYAEPQAIAAQAAILIGNLTRERDSAQKSLADAEAELSRLRSGMVAEPLTRAEREKVAKAWDGTRYQLPDDAPCYFAVPTTMQAIRLGAEAQLAKMRAAGVGSAQAATTAPSARAAFRAMLEEDGMEEAYRSNVAMLLHDRWGITDHGKRNRCATEILALICRDDYVEVLKEHDRNPLPVDHPTTIAPPDDDFDLQAGGPGMTLEETFRRYPIAPPDPNLNGLLLAMDEGTPWPTSEVLLKLAEAADILLDGKGYDGHGWELIGEARDRARKQAQAIRASLVGATTIAPLDANLRETLAKKAYEVAAHSKDVYSLPWDVMNETGKEVYRRIGEALWFMGAQHQAARAADLENLLEATRREMNALAKKLGPEVTP